MMKLFKKVVDERQELEILKIEHVVFWIVFWLLLVSIIVQTMFTDAVQFTQVLPELVIFMFCCVGLLAGCIRKGQWDFWTRPTIKTYVLTAVTGSVVFGVIYGVSLYVRDTGTWQDHMSQLALLTVFMIAFLFAAIFVLSVIIGSMVKKKQEKLAKKYEDESIKE
jgi:CDP-diglyceride synthetase